MYIDRKAKITKNSRLGTSDAEISRERKDTQHAHTQRRESYPSTHNKTFICDRFNWHQMKMGWGGVGLRAI